MSQGVVCERWVVQGQAIDRGQPLFRIATVTELIDVVSTVKVELGRCDAQIGKRIDVNTVKILTPDHQPVAVEERPVSIRNPPPGHRCQFNEGLLERLIAQRGKPPKEVISSASLKRYLGGSAGKRTGARGPFKPEHGFVEPILRNLARHYFWSNSPDVPNAADLWRAWVQIALHLSSSLPARVDDFLERKQLIKAVEQQLSSGQRRKRSGVVVLVGPPGAGKTALAIHFAHEHLGRYMHVLWVSAAAGVPLDDALASCAAEFGVMQSTPAVMSWLAAQKRWLLIVDDASDEHTALLRSLPSSGDVLVTSRARILEPAIEVSALSPREATAFLRSRLPRHVTRKDISVLVREPALARMPITLRICAAEMRARGCSAGTLLAELGTAKDPVARGLERLIDLDAIRGARAPAANLLCIAAFLAPCDIPVEPLRGSKAAAGSLGDVEDSVRWLLGRSLVDAGSDRIRFHALVQASVRGQLQAAARSWLSRTLRLLDYVFPQQVDDPLTWRDASAWLPHVRVALGHARSLGAAGPRAAELLNRMGVYLTYNGDANEAVACLQEAAQIARATRDPARAGLVSFLNHLAGALSRLRRFDEALVVADRALAAGRRARRLSQESRVAVLNNRARVLEHLDRHEAAWRAYRSAFRVATTSRLQAVPASNLARVAATLGRSAAAREWSQRARALALRAWGPQHARYAEVLYGEADLALRYRHLDDAAHLIGEALEIDRAAHGDTHPMVARDLELRANVHLLRGTIAKDDPALARSLFERAREDFDLARTIRVRRHDPDAPTSLYGLASALTKLKRLAEAAEAIRQVLDHDRALARGRPSSHEALSLRALGQIEVDDGKPREAKAHFLESLAIERALARKDQSALPRIGMCHYGLGRAFAGQGDKRRARREFMQALRVLAPLGDDHLYVTKVREALADLADRGRASPGARRSSLGKSPSR